MTKKRVKATGRDVASRKYRMGKIHAGSDTIGGLSATFCDYLEWCDLIEWDVETISGCATVYTNYKGEIEQTRYYND